MMHYMHFGLKQAELDSSCIRWLVGFYTKSLGTEVLIRLNHSQSRQYKIAIQYIFLIVMFKSVILDAEEQTSEQELRGQNKMEILFGHYFCIILKLHSNLLIKSYSLKQVFIEHLLCTCNCSEYFVMIKI